MFKKCFESPLFRTLFARKGTKMDLDRLRDQLISDEGVVYAVYLDHLGYPTMGVGHLITPDDPEHGWPVGTEVSYQRVWNAFEQDVHFKIDESRRLYSNFDTWPGEVQEIMVNMMFNMGRSRLSGFKRMHAALEKNDWREAAREGRDSRWYRQVTNRAERLMTRLENVG
jgi:GH24 family phage-related lysozyme (muramidase)